VARAGGDLGGGLGRGEHADLDRGHGHVVEDRGELRTDDGRGNEEEVVDAHRVLRGQCGDDTRAVTPVRCEDLQVGLYAGEAARI
jgi:hypothetical protein